MRLSQHQRGNGSSWTKKYTPIKVLEMIPNCDDYDEDKYTLKYMEIYGINNVRGGSFCEIQLSDENKITIERMICGSTDCCYVCGEKGHRVNECPNNYDKLYNKLQTLLKQTNRCRRCYREGHSASECYAKKTEFGDTIDESSEEDVWECEYCGKEFDTEKGCLFHEKVHCGKKHRGCCRIENTCYKCGRKGHISSNCYARRHVKGFRLH